VGRNDCRCFLCRKLGSTDHQQVKEMWFSHGFAPLGPERSKHFFLYENIDITPRLKLVGFMVKINGPKLQIPLKTRDCASSV